MRVDVSYFYIWEQAGRPSPKGRGPGVSDHMIDSGVRFQASETIKKHQMQCFFARVLIGGTNKSFVRVATALISNTFGMVLGRESTVLVDDAVDTLVEPL